MASSVPSPAPARPLRVFVSYAHEDRKLKEMFDLNLKVLSQQGLITTWTDNNLLGGDIWNEVIESELRSADLILFMVTNAFLASKFIRENEMKIAMEMFAEEKAIIVPVILKPCVWRVEKWAGRQPLPSLVKAVTDWDDQEKGFYAVEKGLRDVIEQEQVRREQVRLENERQRIEREKQEQKALERERRKGRTTGTAVGTGQDREAGTTGETGGSREGAGDGKTEGGNGGAPWLIWGVTAVLAVLLAVGAWAFFKHRNAPWSLPSNEAKLQLLDESGASIDSVTVEGFHPLPWVDAFMQTENPSFRFHYGYRAFDEEILGPVAMHVYALHARMNGEPKLDGKELVFDRITKPEAKKLPQGEVMDLVFAGNPGWLAADDKIPVKSERAATPSSFVSITLGPKGALPTGVHELGVVLERAGELLGRSKLRIKVSDEWGLPEKRTKIRVLDMNDQPVEGQVIRAVKAPQFKAINLGDKKAYDYTNGVVFPLKFQSKGENIPGPLTAQFYLKATAAPMSPAGGGMMSTAWPLISKPLPAGFTMTQRWALGELMDATALTAGATKEEPHVQFGVNPCGSPIYGSIPAGPHEVGVEIVNGYGDVIYRNIWKLDVKDPAPPPVVVNPELPKTAPMLVLADTKTPLNNQVVPVMRDRDELHGNGIQFGVFLRHDGSLAGSVGSFDLQYFAVPNAAGAAAAAPGQILVDPEAVFPGSGPWKQVYKMGAGSPFSHFSCWTFGLLPTQPAENGQVVQLKYLVLYVGKNGVIPAGRHKVHLKYYKEAGNLGEVAAEADFEIEVPPVWSLPESETKLIVTDANGKSIEDGHLIPAQRAPTLTKDPATQKDINSTVGLAFDLKIQGKDAPVKGDWIITYYLRAVAAPTVPTGATSISVHPRFMLPQPMPDGYTAVISWGYPGEGAPLPEHLGFWIGDESQQGVLLPGVHNVGLQISKKDGPVLYRGVVKLNVN